MQFALLLSPFSTLLSIYQAIHYLNRHNGRGKENQRFSTKYKLWWWSFTEQCQNPRINYNCKYLNTTCISQQIEDLLGMQQCVRMKERNAVENERANIYYLWGIVMGVIGSTLKELHVLLAYLQARTSRWPFASMSLFSQDPRLLSVPGWALTALNYYCSVDWQGLLLSFPLYSPLFPSCIPASQQNPASIPTSAVINHS